MTRIGGKDADMIMKLHYHDHRQTYQALPWPETHPGMRAQISRKGVVPADFCIEMPGFIKV